MRILIAFLALLGLALVAQPAHAQMPVNCSRLTGTPYVCVTNMSHFPIDMIQANTVSSFGTNWVHIPGGMILPGHTQVVNFANWRGKCVLFVEVHTMAGATHVLPSVNICHATRIIVSGW